MTGIDVIATLVNTTHGQTLTAKHPAAEFLAIVTHIVRKRIKRLDGDTNSNFYIGYGAASICD
jgi:hypothetical protein